jgi:hypothetical protein
MRRRERGSKQQLNNLEERRVYCKLKQKALDCPLWKGYGPVVKRNRKEYFFYRKKFLKDSILCTITA